MKVGYNLKIDSLAEWRLYAKYGKSLFEKHQQLVFNEQLKGIGYILQRLSGDLWIDGTLLQDAWFPRISADVFISHSSKDSNIALGLAGWLKQTFNLTSFIDSCVWGRIDELHNTLNNGLNNVHRVWDPSSPTHWELVYDYGMNNFIASNVHIMLSMALNQMIDKTDKFIFLNTRNSSPISYCQFDSIKQMTESVWIYSEIVMSKMLQARDRDKRFTKEAQLSPFKFRYGLDLSHLKEVTKRTLQECVKCEQFKRILTPYFL